VTPKHPAAVQLGRRGGKARAANRTKEELSEIGRRGAEARWHKQLEKIKKVTDEITAGTKILLKRARRRESELARANFSKAKKKASK
jgi:general stress protein YciG